MFPMWGAGLVSGESHIFPRTSLQVIVAFEVSPLKHVSEPEGFEGQWEGSGAQFWSENTAMDVNSLSFREGSAVHIMGGPEQFGN